MDRIPARVVSILAAVVVTQLGFACRPHPSLGPLAVAPVGLDSGASARWFKDRRVACAGKLVLVYDEDMIGRLRSDSTVVYQYERSLAGVQCLAHATRTRRAEGL